MAYDITGGSISITLEAAADLSSSQYRFVTLDANGKAAVCGTNSKPIGVLQNKPTSGEAATVMVAGITKLEVSEAVDEGDILGATDTTGKGNGEPAADEYVAGQAITAGGGDGEIITAAVSCLAPSLAT